AWRVRPVTVRGRVRPGVGRAGSAGQVLRLAQQGGEAPGVALLVAGRVLQPGGELAAHGDRAGLGVLEEPLAPVAAAEARGLHAAHGGVHAAPGRRVAVVDVDRAGQEALGDGPPAGGVAAVHAGVEPVLGVVGLLDRLVVAVHRVDGHHPAEGLLPVEVHLGGGVGEHGGPVEQAAVDGAGAAA